MRHIRKKPAVTAGMLSLLAALLCLYLYLQYGRDMDVYNTISTTSSNYHEERITVVLFIIVFLTQWLQYNKTYTRLCECGFLIRDNDKYIHLTEKGKEIAEMIYERHRFLQNV